MLLLFGLFRSWPKTVIDFSLAGSYDIFARSENFTERDRALPFFSIDDPLPLCEAISFGCTANSTPRYSTAVSVVFRYGSLKFDVNTGRFQPETPTYLPADFSVRSHAAANDLG